MIATSLEPMPLRSCAHQSRETSVEEVRHLGQVVLQPFWGNSLAQRNVAFLFTTVLGGFGLATFMRCMITSRTIDRMQRQNLLRQKRKSRDQCKTATPTWSQGLSHNGFEQKCNSQFVASGTNGAGDEAAKLFSATRLFHS